VIPGSWQRRSRAHADNVVDRETEAFVELDRCGVAHTNLEVDLGAPDLVKALLCALHQEPTDAGASQFRGVSGVVDPIAMTVVFSKLRQHERVPAQADSP